ncbi:MAG TPA: hypothetical protein VNI83_04050, partial [Vicinamibacterales bacterium]|nr:hypothetical protein [Vicinamibacterales bacterium]
MPDLLAPDVTAKVVEFARACKAAARAVSLYPTGHPAIGSTLARLVEAAAQAADGGALALDVQPGRLLVAGAAPARPDPALGELADLLHRHQIGSLVVRSGTDADTWRALLLLLARAPEENLADGGIARLWTRTGGPSVEIREIDYAEVLRERAGAAAVIDEVVAACLKGTPTLGLDDETMRALLGIVNDPPRLRELIDRLKEATAAEGRGAHAAAFLKLLKNLAEYVAAAEPERLEGLLRHMADGAARLSADGMATLLDQRATPAAQAGSLDVVHAVVDRISDPAIASFVADAVVEDHGATERLAYAFEALVPEIDRKRQLLSLAEEQVEQSPLGQEESFEELWRRVEQMLLSYRDQSYVPDEYARQLSAARTRALDVEQTSDDPPERIAAWVATVSDAALRQLDAQLLADLLAVERDAARWRDVAETVAAHIDDLCRIGQQEAAWQLAERLVAEAADDPPRAGQAARAFERLARGLLVRHALGGL